jgi:hypothetical protein
MHVVLWPTRLVLRSRQTFANEQGSERVPEPHRLRESSADAVGRTQSTCYPSVRKR